MVEKDLSEELRQAEQQIKFLETINKSLQLKTNELKNMEKSLEEKIRNSEQSHNELKQEKLLLEHIKKRLYNNSEKVKQHDEKTTVLDLFRNMKQLSFSLLVTLTKIKEDKLKTILSELEAQEKITFAGDVKDPVCNECSFTQLESRFCCPKCKSTSFDDDDILEHFNCGNISRRASYDNDACPQCKKELQALGVDYKIDDSNIHFCNQCNEKFQQPSLILLCRKCNTMQTVEKAKWIYNRIYRLLYKV